MSGTLESIQSQYVEEILPLDVVYVGSRKTIVSSCLINCDPSVCSKCFMSLSFKWDKGSICCCHPHFVISVAGNKLIIV